MRVYLAGAAAEQARLRNEAVAWQSAGHEITSRWIDADISTGAALELTPEQVHDVAIGDLIDVSRADAIIMYVPLGEGALYHTGGRHVEVGYAIALGKAVVIVGKPENIFERGLGRIVRTTFEAQMALRTR